ncbi:MAG: ATP-binding protein, partial [Actinomycetota bacterium]
MDTSQLVGRERELESLSRYWDEAFAGKPRFVLCRGDPGVGKTKLAEALSAQITGRGGVCVWGRGAEAEGAPPYWPWRRTLVNLAAQVDYERVLQESGASAGDLVLIAPELRSFGPEEQASQETVGSERRFQLFQSVGNLIKTAAAGRGLLIILEDLHGADQPTLLLLMHLVRWVADAQILLLATFRPPEL